MCEYCVNWVGMVGLAAQFLGAGLKIFGKKFLLNDFGRLGVVLVCEKFWVVHNF